MGNTWEPIMPLLIHSAAIYRIARGGRAIAHIRVDAAEFAARVQPRIRLVGIEYSLEVFGDVPGNVCAEFVISNDRTIDLALKVGRRIVLQIAGQGAIGTAYRIGDAATVEPDAIAGLRLLQP